MREVNIDNCTSKGPNHKKEDDSFKIEIKNFLNLIFDAMTRMIWVLKFFFLKYSLLSKDSENYLKQSKPQNQIQELQLLSIIRNQKQISKLAAKCL